MKNGRSQAKDITDDTMLAAVRATQGLNGVPRWSSLFDIEAIFPDMPAKVVRAKLASLVRRRILDGCTCGCRGDFEFVTDPGDSTIYAH
jgi:hypothetical protein